MTPSILWPVPAPPSIPYCGQHHPPLYTLARAITTLPPCCDLCQHHYPSHCDLCQHHPPSLPLPLRSVLPLQVSSFSDAANAASYNPEICSKGRVEWPTNYTSVVAFNEVADIATGPARLSDNGGIYSPAINTVFRHNYVHNVGCFTFGGQGFYGEGGGCNLTYAFNAARPLSHCASTTLRPRCASPSPPRPVACARCATHRARRTRGTSST